MPNHKGFPLYWERLLNAILDSMVTWGDSTSYRPTFGLHSASIVSPSPCSSRLSSANPLKTDPGRWIIEPFGGRKKMWFHWKGFGKTREHSRGRERESRWSGPKVRLFLALDFRFSTDTSGWFGTNTDAGCDICENGLQRDAIERTEHRAELHDTALIAQMRKALITPSNVKRP